MSTLLLAIRNLLRNRRRSLTTILTMVVGLTAILLFGGYRSNILYGTLTGFVEFTGHLQIQRTGYFLDGGDTPTDYGIVDYQKIITALENDPVLKPMLTVVTPTLQLGGIAGNYAVGVSRSVLAVGLDPARHNQMMRWNEFNVVSYAKPLALEGKPTDTVVVGAGVARKLKLCDLLSEDCQPALADKAAAATNLPGDIAALSEQEANSASDVPYDHASERALKQEKNRIEMLAATASGAPNVASLSVIQATNMGIKALDDVYMAMHLSQAQRLIYGNGTPQVTAIQVQFKHTDQLAEGMARVKLILQQQFGNQPLTALDFGQLNPMYKQTLQFMDTMFGFIAMLIGVIVLFTIGNTMSTAVVERTVEIGTLRAIGLRRSGIRRLFLCEAALLGVIGSIFGALSALLIAWLINHSGWTWTPPGYSYAYLILVRVGEDLPLLFGNMLSMVLVTLLSAWWPARRASQLQIVDALRHV